MTRCEIFNQNFLLEIQLPFSLLTTMYTLYVFMFASLYISHACYIVYVTFYIMPVSHCFNHVAFYVCYMLFNKSSNTQDLNSEYIFTALHVMQTRYCDENSVYPSVRLSVRPSVTRVDCDKTVERSVQIYIPYESKFSLVF